MGMGDAGLSSLVLIFQIFSSSQIQIKPGNIILLFSVCCGADLSIVIYFLTVFLRFLCLLQLY